MGGARDRTCLIFHLTTDSRTVKSPPPFKDETALHSPSLSIRNVSNHQTVTLVFGVVPLTGMEIRKRDHEYCNRQNVENWPTCTAESLWLYTIFVIVSSMSRLRIRVLCLRITVSVSRPFYLPFSVTVPAMLLASITERFQSACRIAPGTADHPQRRIRYVHMQVWRIIKVRRGCGPSKYELWFDCSVHKS